MPHRKIPDQNLFQGSRASRLVDHRGGTEAWRDQDSLCLMCSNTGEFREGTLSAPEAERAGAEALGTEAKQERGREERARSSLANLEWSLIGVAWNPWAEQSGNHQEAMCRVLQLPSEPKAGANEKDQWRKCPAPVTMHGCYLCPGSSWESRCHPCRVHCHLDRV